MKRDQTTEFQRAQWEAQMAKKPVAPVHTHRAGVKTALKRALMWLYGHEVISFRTTQRLYDWLGLSEY